MRKRMAAALLFPMLFVGCCEDPANKITLVDAMTQVGQGLRAMHDAAHPAGDKDSKPFGLYADQVSVTFNVQATKASGNQLVLSADVAPPVIPVKAGASDTYSTSSSRSRGNTIVVTFKNPMFASTGELAHDIVTGISSGSETPKTPTPSPSPTPKPAADAPTAPATQPQDRAKDRVTAFEDFLNYFQNTVQENLMDYHARRALPPATQPQ